MTIEEDDRTFRFSTKMEYNIEIAKIIKQLDKLRARKPSKYRKNESALENLYEELIEEYLRFCGEEVDG